MPPKKSKMKTTKEKPIPVVDGLSTEDMNKDQLEAQIVVLREELDRIREERSYFQLERDKIRDFWEITKSKLKEAEAEMRKKSTEKDEAKERHRVEISVYKQKLRHILSEQHNAVTEMKIDTIMSTSLVQKQNTKSELTLRRDVQDLQRDFRHKEFHNIGSIKEIKLKHQVELMEMSNRYECKLQELDVKYHKEMETIMKVEVKRRNEKVKELNQKMRTRITAMKAEHEEVVKRAEDLYYSAQIELEKNQKSNMEEVKKMQNQEDQLRKGLYLAQQEKQHLGEELHELQQKLPESQKQLQEYQDNKERMMTYCARVKVLEKELRDLKIEHELLLQATQKIQQERDDLLRRQTESILDLQQRSRLKWMLLERKMEALTETLEMKEAQLYAAQSVSSIDPTVRSDAANKLQEILESKRVAMETLQKNLDEECMEYDNLLKSHRLKLQAAGGLPQDFPFKPSKQLLKEAPPRG